MQYNLGIIFGYSETNPKLTQGNEGVERTKSTDYLSNRITGYTQAGNTKYLTDNTTNQRTHRWWETSTESSKSDNKTLSEEKIILLFFPELLSIKYNHQYTLYNICFINHGLLYSSILFISFCITISFFTKCILQHIKMGGLKLHILRHPVIIWQSTEEEAMK